MTCVHCQGSGRQRMQGFVCGGVSAAGVFDIRCPECRGTGELPDLTPRWRELGREIFEIRNGHDESGRDFARHLGVTPGQLNQAEHGRIDPTDLLEAARAWARLQGAEA